MDSWLVRIKDQTVIWKLVRQPSHLEVASTHKLPHFSSLSGLPSSKDEAPQQFAYNDLKIIRHRRNNGLKRN